MAIRTVDDVTPPGTHGKAPVMQPNEVLQHISRYGVAASELQLEWLARQSVARHAAPAIVSLLTDRSAAPVVRERAAARTVAAIDSLPPEYRIMQSQWSAA